LHADPGSRSDAVTGFAAQRLTELAVERRTGAADAIEALTGCLPGAEARSGPIRNNAAKSLT